MTESSPNAEKGRQCSHAVTTNMRRVITYVPKDEQASAGWGFASTCVDCGATVMGGDLL